jgi:hypothetical protein
MSEKILLHLYYGEGEILHLLEGVSLHEFNCMERLVTRPGEKTLTTLHK